MIKRKSDSFYTGLNLMEKRDAVQEAIFPTKSLLVLTYK